MQLTNTCNLSTTSVNMLSCSINLAFMEHSNHLSHLTPRHLTLIDMTRFAVAVTNQNGVCHSVL